MRINEIFYSIQGEGFNAGKPAVFVRFSGCNLKCPFCDTLHQKGVIMTEKEIVTEVNKYPTNLVILTGGEPTLFCTKILIEKLRAAGKKIAIETNGTNEINFDVDFLTLSPKFEFTNNAELKITQCNELKVIFTSNNDMSKYDNIVADNYYVQPCDTGDKEKNIEIMKKTVQYVLQNPKWKISLQLQKILKIQ